MMQTALRSDKAATDFPLNRSDFTFRQLLCMTKADAFERWKLGRDNAHNRFYEP